MRGARGLPETPITQRIRLDSRNPLPTRQLHLEHLQPAPGAVQAQRVPQGHPAADGAAPLRLSARPHQSAGAKRIRAQQDQAGSRRRRRAEGDHRAPVLQPVQARLAGAVGRPQPARPQSERLHQRLFGQRARDHGAVRLRAADCAHGRKESALRGGKAVQRGRPVAGAGG